jgi:hypothetical protein
MRKLIVITLLLTLGLISKAQIPGYMGKKHMFIYSPSLSIFGSEYRVKSSSGAAKFYISHNLTYNYVIKKRMTIGLLYEYSGFNVNVGTARYENDYTAIFGRFRKHQFGLVYRKYFRSTNLAPLGTYMKFSLSAINSKTTIDPEFNEAVLYDDNNPDKIIAIESWDVAPGFGIGKQFIVAKFIPLNFEVNIQLPLSSMFAYPVLDIEKSQLYSTLGSTMIKFNLGIGILAF